MFEIVFELLFCVFGLGWEVEEVVENLIGLIGCLFFDFIELMLVFGGLKYVIVILMCN